MTVDERIDKLVASHEALAKAQDKTQIMLAGIVDSIKRLERIAVAHTLDLEDIDAVLARLEGRAPRKPQ